MAGDICGPAFSPPGQGVEEMQFHSKNDEQHFDMFVTKVTSCILYPNGSYIS